MNKQPKKSGRFVEFLTGKGFYVILFLCVAAIGVSGYMLIFSGNRGILGDDPLAYLDQEVNANAELDRAAIPDWPTISPTPGSSPAPGVQESGGAHEDDVPVAAVTTIPKPDPVASETSKPSPASKTSESTPAPKSGAKTVYVWPVKGETINAFSSSDLVYNKTMGDWRVHLGIDIEGELGAQVCATADGKVTDVYDDVFWGTTVIIDHGNDITSQYSNLMKKPVVAVGDTVKAGQVIGGIGMTAEAERREVNHLHFTMTKDNKPVDPKQYLPAQ